MRNVLFILCLFAFVPTKAQHSSKRFERIDSLARAIDAKSIDTVVYNLTKTCKSEVAKVRAVFVWITDHVQYDVAALKRKPIYSSYTYYTREDSLQKEKLLIANKADSVFKKRKAVCEGYSSLMKRMFDIANIKSEIINGFGRNDVNDTLSTLDSSNHAWNAVLLDGTWYLLDVTWASGFVNNANTKFTKEFNEFYFLSKPNLLIKNHFPDEPKWQLLNTTISRDSFFKQVYVTSQYFEEGIQSIQPSESILNVSKKSNKVIFKVEDSDSSCFFHIEQFPKPKKLKNVRTDFRNDFIEKSNPQLEKYFEREVQILPTTNHIEIVVNMVVVAEYKVVWRKDEE